MSYILHKSLLWLWFSQLILSHTRASRHINIQIRLLSVSQFLFSDMLHHDEVYLSDTGSSYPAYNLLSGRLQTDFWLCSNISNAMFKWQLSFTTRFHSCDITALLLCPKFLVSSSMLLSRTGVPVTCIILHTLAQGFLDCLCYRGTPSARTRLLSYGQTLTDILKLQGC